ncbi:unnamed protein product [Pleuronectes platessa]|uniref:Uncharacterized protein n=1 Tax=Pleuronectes platessa TaxID=8262 RepID=A0A9N7U8D1_PLEPL|nr:unnamed protein product [Pleuronectes platessa]
MAMALSSFVSVLTSLCGRVPRDSSDLYEVSPVGGERPGPTLGGDSERNVFLKPIEAALEPNPSVKLLRTNLSYFHQPKHDNVQLVCGKGSRLRPHDIKPISVSWI